MASLKEFVGENESFYKLSGMDQILVLAWYSEARANRKAFGGPHMRTCFREVGVEPPNMSLYLPRLAAKKPPQLIREGQAYRLSGLMRRKLDEKYGGELSGVIVKQALADLPAKVPDVAERTFLIETLACYKVKAYRATVVMMWNLAYNHLALWVMADAGRLAALNEKLATQKTASPLVIKAVEDFGWLKEGELIEWLLKAKLIDKTMVTILKEKLGKRNLAAHPSTHEITQFQADEMIHDLVVNLMLKLT